MRVLNRRKPGYESRVGLLKVAFAFAAAAVVGIVYGSSVAWSLWQTVTISILCVVIFSILLTAVLLESCELPLELIAGRVLSISQGTANVLFWDYPQRPGNENDPFVARDVFQIPVTQLPSECITPQSQIWIVATPYDYLIQQVLPRINDLQPPDEKLMTMWKAWSNDLPRLNAQNSA